MRLKVQFILLLLLWLETGEGSIYFACSTKVNTNFHLQAKVEPLKWAIKPSANLVFDLIFIEGNSKVAVEALSKPELEIPWRILNICSNMSLLLSLFINVFVN